METIRFENFDLNEFIYSKERKSLVYRRALSSEEHPLKNRFSIEGRYKTLEFEFSHKEYRIFYYRPIKA